MREERVEAAGLGAMPMPPVLAPLYDRAGAGVSGVGCPVSTAVTVAAMLLPACPPDENGSSGEPIPMRGEGIMREVLRARVEQAPVRMSAAVMGRV